MEGNERETLETTTKRCGWLFEQALETKCSARATVPVNGRRGDAGKTSLYCPLNKE